MLGTTGNGEAGRKLVTAWKGPSGQRVLAGAGWKPADNAAAPDPGVLAALRQLWLDQR